MGNGEATRLSTWNRQRTNTLHRLHVKIGVCREILHANENAEGFQVRVPGLGFLTTYHSLMWRGCMTDVQKFGGGKWRKDGVLVFAFRNTHSSHIAAAQDLGQVFSALVMTFAAREEIQSAYVILSDRDPIILPSQKVGHDESLILRPSRQGL